MKDRRKIIVIGAGAAGMMAAGRAAFNGNEVILIEKNNILGKKILISGKGRCNITNNTDIDGLIENIPGNGRFLYSSFYTFSNRDIIDFFEENGLKTKVERGQRIFPVSDKAKDVVVALEKYLKKGKVKILLKVSVNKIKTKSGKVYSVILENGEEILCDGVIICTGGISYKGTGSTGDGYKFAKNLGHTVKTLRPSLVPLVAKENFLKELQGLSLKNVAIKIINKDNKKIYDDFGEMIFTHFGVSGPIILSASRHILDYEYKDVKLLIDLKPALSEEKLDERLRRDFEKFTRKQFKNSLGELLPQKMIPVVIKLSGILPEKFVNQITKEERKKLVQLLKGIEITITGSRPIEEAIVTVGGVSTEEINPSTMESKLVKGLYFAGEVIDLDGYTGGFNLTIAFSTGYLAGMNA